MTSSPTHRQRSRTTPPAPPVDLASVAATRNELDGIAGKQRRREDALITDYVAATNEATGILTRRDVAIAKHHQQIRTLTDAAEHAVANTEKRRAAALAELNEHRSVKELAAMFGLPPKRITKYIQSHRADIAPSPAPEPESGTASTADTIPAVEGEPGALAPATRDPSPMPRRPVNRATGSTGTQPDSAPSRRSSVDGQADGTTPDASRPGPDDTGAERLF